MDKAETQISPVASDGKFAHIHARLQAQRYKCVLGRWMTPGPFIVKFRLKWADLF